MNETKKTLTGRDKQLYLAIIAGKDAEIYNLKEEHRRELAEKDKTIRYWGKTAEKAIDRKKQAIRSADRRARLNLSYALLIIAGMTVIPWLLWLFDTAMKYFWLWGNG